MVCADFFRVREFSTDCAILHSRPVIDRVTMRTTLTDRVRARLVALVESKRIRQKTFASALNISQGAISQLLSGSRGIDLDYLPTFADIAEVGVADLVVPPGSFVLQLSQEERELMMAYRDMPEDVRHALMVLVRHLPQPGRRKEVFELIRSASERSPRRR